MVSVGPESITCQEGEGTDLDLSFFLSWDILQERSHLTSSGDVSPGVGMWSVRDPGGRRYEEGHSTFTDGECGR